MRQLYEAGGQTYKGLSRQFGVSSVMVKHIIQRNFWKHV
jgi:hypothetical protein